MRKTLFALIALALLFGAYGCRTASDSTPDEIDEEVIEASIRTQVAQEFPGDTFDFGISVSETGVVTLDGTVETDDRAERIGELAASVSGVTRVINNLEGE